MSVVEVKTGFQITLPNALREQAGIGIGDLLEVEFNGQYLTLKPREIVNPETVDAAIQAGLRDVQEGRVTPAFKSMQEFEEFLLAEKP